MKRHNIGYTLIEILIVLFIVSIVTSVALISISHNENKYLESFANDMTQLMTLAEEQAILQPAILGLSLNEQSFQFLSWQPMVNKDKKEEKKNNWAPLEDNILSNHMIPNNIQVQVRTGDKSSKSEEETKTDHPQIIISTNGDITPFTIYIGKKGQKPRYAITGDADGNITNKLLS